MKQAALWVAGALALSFQASAETLNLDQAIERALHYDPRIEEREHLVNAARALIKEAEGHKDWIIDFNTFLGFSPAVDGGFFETDCPSGGCQVRSDRFDLNGLSLWNRADLSIIKPLYTFGKIERYSDAARANVEVTQGNVRLQRAATVLDVKRAYYGYLAASETRQLLADVNQRIDKAMDLVQHWLDEETNNMKQSDLYALQSGSALVERYLVQAQGMERVALEGLKVLTGVGLDTELRLADERIVPVPMPAQELSVLQNEALKKRPEMTQVEAGLRARRALVAAHKAETRPDIYAGVAGMLSYSPGRDRLDNPYISDPFNDAGITPLIGLKWNWVGDVQDAKVARAEEELNALISKASLARLGIPYEVAEQYHQAQAYAQAVQAMEEASRAARRWMISSYADFEAGVEDTDKVIAAFQAYVLAHSDYLRTVYDFNMYVAQLDKAVGVER